MPEFIPDTGSAKVKNPIFIIMIVAFAALASYLISSGGIKTAMMLILLPFVAYIVIRVFTQPRVGLIFAFSFSFFAIGLSRYVPNIPFGLAIDGFLFLSLIAILLGRGRDINWKVTNHDVTILSLVWFGVVLLEIVNPLAVSFQAWFYAMRGVALYQVLMVPIGFLLIKDIKDLKLFIWIWMILSFFAALKGIQQVTIGPDPWETAWLDGGGELTHRIQGRLRAFSFYSDAGLFGAAMGHTSLFAAIIAMGPGTKLKKWIFAGISVFTLMGMLYSGTRGALFVPAPGIMLYLFLRKNFKVFLIGVIGVIVIYGALRYTSVGNNNYQVYRIRTAVQPKLDKSYQVRIENQQRLKIFLRNKPFGGGIGSAGNWGMRFSPNTFLAQTPTDSWYVKIWAEMGIIGLSIHLFILFWILIHCSIISWKLKDPELRQIIIGLTAGIAGIMVASYGNGLYGQMPIAMVIFMSYVFVYLSPKWDKQLLSDPNRKKDILFSGFNKKPTSQIRY